MGQSYDSYAAGNAIDGDLNTYTAAKFLPPNEVYFYLWIYFGKAYLFHTSNASYWVVKDSIYI